ncbi:MAG: GntR family transcriptional regulator [Xanthomonadales bacterium]|jgi:DNA-binding GntR family transcriptional regulator|nr:GntR family transcriptional regulator [Gammaproteobacteria bacterium]MBT8064517.1 GntR family transcriptional regulator [Gammaproteobacteria bacterium]NNK32569.1 GntR family transcriptional regulator [Xanthomonadales bacterium]NNK37466.1 GntR family transcriptional regulator [Xanthomonadales bacterium]
MNAENAANPKPPSLAEQAYELLEEKLVTLELAPGSMISEGQLIDLTGLGRTPVREAMLRLADQELIHVIPRRGLRIAPVSRSAMLHILEARKPLEQVVVYRAALNARDEQRSGLASIARALTISHDRFEEFLRLDTELGDLLDYCAGNPFVSAAVRPLRSHCRRFWYYYRNRMQISDAISANSKLARLVARRDYNGSRKASDGVMAVMERFVASVDRLG